MVVEVVLSYGTHKGSDASTWLGKGYHCTKEEEHEVTVAAAMLVVLGVSEL